MPNNVDPLLQRVRPTDAELEQEAQATPADLAQAVAAFNLHAPANAKGLLDAVPEVTPPRA